MKRYIEIMKSLLGRERDIKQLALGESVSIQELK